MNRCYLSLGSNQKSPERQIRQAITALQRMPQTSLIKVSNLHWTKAWGLHAQQDFCNALVAINTRLSPLALLEHCQKIELKQGRVRKRRWGPRTLDIDIILYAQRIINTPRLKIPHPHCLKRDFVLIPLLEIHPLFSPYLSALSDFKVV